MVHIAELDTDYVFCIAASADFRCGGELCFAACLSGLLRSDDGGITWLDVYTPFDLKLPTPTMAVAVASSYANERIIVAGLAGGLLRSVDDGQHWESIYFSSPPSTVSAIVISPDVINDGLMFAATLDDGVFCSRNHGQDWDAWNFGLLDRAVLSLAISPSFSFDSTLVVGTSSGIFRSTNGGVSWCEVPTPTGTEVALALSFSSNYKQGSVIYAGTESHGLLRSTDSGFSWARLAENELVGSVTALYSSEENLFAIVDGKVFLSTDDGILFTCLQHKELSGVEASAVYVPIGQKGVLVGLANGGIIRL